MDDLIDIMQDVLCELQSINTKLDNIQGRGLYSIEDIHSKLEDTATAISNLQGNLISCTLEDVCDKLDSIDSTLDGIDTTVSLIG